MNVVEGIETVASELLEKRRAQVQIREQNRSQYLQRLQDAYADGRVSWVERVELDHLKETLGISDEDAAAMEAEVSRPLEEKQNKLLLYEKALRAAIAEGYPDNEALVSDLAGYRERLGLGPEDIEALDQAIRAEAEATSQPLEPPPAFTNSIGMEFVLIPAGEFMMGSPDSDAQADGDERPPHLVTINEPFYLGKYPVTQAQWQAVMGTNPSRFKGRDRAVERVSWDDVQVFMQKLNELEKVSSYRLPTEAQWEYACRAGSRTLYHFGNDESRLGEYAWYVENAEGKTHPVGQKQPNDWGLYDMHGHVFEWCHDGWRDYKPSLAVDPVGPTEVGAGRVIRGGGWGYSAHGVRSAYRQVVEPAACVGYLGFRCSSSGGHVAN